MKTVTNKILPAALALLSLCACDKTPENGDLDGLWRLEERHTRPDGASAYSLSADLPETTIYWAFQLKLLDIRVNGTPPVGTPSEVFARFSHTDNTLAVTETYLHERATDTPITADMQIEGQPIDLSPLGLHAPTDLFRIVRLDSRRMTLCSQTDSLVFKKI